MTNGSKLHTFVGLRAYVAADNVVFKCAFSCRVSASVVRLVEFNTFWKKIVV